MQKRRRTFIAINLPADVKKRLARFQGKWADVPAKWTPAENLHITVLFLGDLTEQDLAVACQAVKEVAKNHSSFNITLDKIAYGPEGKTGALNSLSARPSTIHGALVPPRYIWAGGGEVEELSALKKDLEQALFEAIKFKMDKVAFTVHITLARIKEWEWRQIEPEERPEVNEAIELIFTAESIDVMESELKRGSPQYTIIESHQLYYLL